MADGGAAMSIVDVEGRKRNLLMNGNNSWVGGDTVET